MAALNFPSSPSDGQIFTENGKTYRYSSSSTSWVNITVLAVSPRVITASATSGNLTINSDVTDVYKAEGLTEAIVFLQPSGTPYDAQKLTIRIEDNGTARGITWTTSSGAFRAVGVTLPTTTVINKVTYVGCLYNTTDGFWDVVATATLV